MKVWITKYALSGGIRIDDLEVRPVHGGGTVYAHERYSLHKMGRDAFDNEADALADADRRRVAKIASLRSQIAKLEKLTF